MKTYSIQVDSEQATLTVAGQLAKLLGRGSTLYLFGPLGAGKTTFTRGLLRGLGYEGKVKSPSYTLVEPYEINGQTLYHCDFYRLDNPAEIEHIGIREYMSPKSICVIEWADKGYPFLPEPDLACYIGIVGEARDLGLEAHSPRGETIIGKLACANDGS